MECEVCGFNNPKGTATAVVIRDGKLLALKRNEDPFKDMWDLPGGYMNEGETPEKTLHRELKEELGVSCTVDYIAAFPGTGFWKGDTFPIISHAFLAEVEGDIQLNTKENAALTWLPLETIDPEQVAFDSNQDIVRFAKEKFFIDLEQLVKLIAQLDSTTQVKENNYYRSVLNGYVSKKFVDGKLVGLGWIFARRTLSRKQAVVEDMIVDESERGKGYGKDILLDLLRWAKENDVEMVELTSAPQRVAANELYKKAGFQLHPTNHYLYKVQ